jgi:hypothetical protein
LVLESDLIKTETLGMPSENPGNKCKSYLACFRGAPIDYNIPVWTLDSSYGRIKPMEDNETKRTLKRNGACCFRKNGYYL